MTYSKCKIIFIILLAGFQINLNASSYHKASIASNRIPPLVQLCNALHSCKNISDIVSKSPLNDTEFSDAIFKANPRITTPISNLQIPLQAMQQDFKYMQELIQKLEDTLMTESLNNQESIWLIKILLRIIPAICKSDLSLIDKDDPEWNFFFRFLEYYATDNINYLSLKSNAHKNFLNHAHNLIANTINKPKENVYQHLQIKVDQTIPLEKLHDALRDLRILIETISQLKLLLDNVTFMNLIFKSLPNIIPSINKLQLMSDNMQDNLEYIQKEKHAAEEILMIESLNDIQSAWHKRLLFAIGPMVYFEDPENLDPDPPGFSFFFRVLKYYAPTSTNYKNLNSDVHRNFITILHERYQQFLNFDQ